MHERTEGTGLRSLAIVILALVAMLAGASVPAVGATYGAESEPVGPAGTEPAGPAGPEPVGPAGPESAEPVGPVTIGSLTLRSQGSGEELELEADGTLVWTQYRDAKDDLVVELPNTRVADGVSGLEAEGLISRVEVETYPAADRPMTRLVISTGRETEHSLTATGGQLNLQFVPTGFEQTTRIAAATPAPVAPFAPVAEGSLGEAEAGLEAEPQQEPGTADSPSQGPQPSGVVATRLEGVEVVQFNGEAVIRVLGDGEFSYSTFSLPDPPRFVIDLEGVVNTSSTPTVFVDSPHVDQVRMAQFRSAPDPVSRVVLDLRTGTFPILESSADGLILRFGASEVAEAEPEAQPELEQLEPIESEESPGIASEEQPAELAQETPLEPLEPARVELEPLPESEVAQEAAPLAPAAVEIETAPQAVAEETAPPLEIRDESAQESPSYEPEEPTDVSLFEAQQVTIAPPPQQTETAPAPAFGVQELGTATEYVGEPISLTLKDADVTEVLRSIARLADLNIVIQPGVAGPVTVELDRVPWDQALEQILKTNNLGQQLEGNILRIAPVAQLEQEARLEQQLAQARALSVPLSTIMRRVSYARAADIARILTRGQRSQGGQFGLLSGAFNQTGILSQRGSVSFDERTNTLIIRELPSQLNTVMQVIQNLDIPEKQVMIEARIVETTRNFSRTLGLDWRINGVADARHGNTTGLTFPNNIDANGGVQLLAGGANGFLNLGLGNVLNTFELDVTLNAAENDGLVNIISAPKVAVLNNEQASIQTGLQIPVQTVANNTVTVQFVNATLRLLVTPQVTAEGTIMMEINIQKREPQLAFAVVGATNAPIATREASTRVIVRDGGTAVIGGIYVVSSNDGSDKVPGLANIPLLGHLFKNRDRSNQNEELLIFITPRVIQL